MSIVTSTASGIGQPVGLAVDGAGNVYIAGPSYGVVAEWSAASNTLITLVSSGLDLDYSVAVDGTGNVYIADTYNQAIKEMPYAFVDPTPKLETLAAGSDVLPVVLPATENLLAPFAPTTDQSWLTISGITNGVMSFSFTAATSNRTGHITLLGQAIPVIQGPLLYYLGTNALSEGPAAGSDNVLLLVSPPGAAWTNTANAAWLHLSPGNQSGTGGTNVVFSFDDNPGATRSGTLTIAGLTLTVTQGGATFTLSTNALLEGVNAGSDSIELTVIPQIGHLDGYGQCHLVASEPGQSKRHRQHECGFQF